MKPKTNMQMVLEKIEGKYLMRDDKITYELRRYDLSDLAQKFLFSIMYKISADFIQPSEVNNNEDGKTLKYKFTFDEIKEEIEYDYRIESIKPKMDKLLKELVSTPITISVFDENKKRKELVNTNLIEKIVLSDDKNFIFITIDERILPFYKATADKFTIWGFEYIALSEKKYTPRLYEFLVEFAKSIGTKNINGVISKTVSVEDLHFELTIPDSYKYDNIKKQILEPCKSELLGLEYSDEDREKFKLFKSFDYIENSKRKSTAGRRAIGSITFNFELLEKTKGLLIGKKGLEATNPEKLEARKEEKAPYYGIIANIIGTIQQQNPNPFISKLTENIFDFTTRVIDIKNDVQNNLGLSEIQDIALENGLIFPLKNLKTADIEEFEFNFRKSLEQNITYWSNRTGKGIAKPRKK